MRELEEKVKSAIKPGTPCGKVFYGAVFFVTGLLLVHYGFWKTLLVLALTLLGVIIGSAETLGKAIGKVVDKVVPPRNQKVVYTPEDMEKVKQATKARKEAAEKPADEAAGADKAEEKPDMARHAARRVAMQMIYCRLQGGVDCESVLSELDDYLNIGEDADYLEAAVKAVAEKQAGYDEVIARLSPKRSLDRIPVIDHAILLLAMHEIESTDTTVEVVVNEAVEIAKRFGDEVDSRFINGVLGSFIRERE